MLDVSVKTPEVHAKEPSQRRRKRRRAWPLRNAGFLLCVILPSVLAAIYYGFIAAPIYLSTAQFVVKDSNQSSSLSGIGQFLQSAGLATSSNDAYSVDAFITSRDALQQLERDVDIRAVYNRPEADFLARFPNFWMLRRTAFEWLYLYYYYLWIEVDFNTTTNINTIYAWAFRPNDAFVICQKLLAVAEDRVNTMNDKAHLNMLRAARSEVSELQQREIDLQKQITDFRNHEQMLNPNQLSTDAENLRMTLESALVSAKALLAQLERAAPNSPQIAVLRARVQGLASQVDDQNHKNSGDANTLAPKMSEYDQLLIQQGFLQQMLAAAVSGLESAEVNILQQTLYIQDISVPNEADFAMYPYRIIDTLLVFISCLFLYGTLKLMVNVAREHILDDE